MTYLFAFFVAYFIIFFLLYINPSLSNYLRKSILNRHRISDYYYNFDWINRLFSHGILEYSYVFFIYKRQVRIFDGWRVWWRIVTSYQLDGKKKTLEYLRWRSTFFTDRKPILQNGRKGKGSFWPKRIPPEKNTTVEYNIIPRQFTGDRTTRNRFFFFIK